MFNDKEKISNKIETLIGENCKVIGSLYGDGLIKINGSIEGDISWNDDVILGVSSYCKSNINCKSAFINGKVEGNVICENVKIGNIELGAIFSNAIENAIIACKKIENPMGRKISVICKEHYGQIYIQISNTFTGQIVFNGEYPVSDSEDHGFGTRSIGAIAEKHGGVFSFTAQNGIFKTTVILNC
jgi:cytoskeletal protein CcmA (bactofilin family)